MSVSDKRQDKAPARESGLSRRAWLTGSATTLLTLPGAGKASPSPAADGQLESIDLELPGAPRVAKVARLLVPRGKFAQPGPPARTLVLLHGLGETKSSALALKAWSELYGLVSADARLRTPPITPLLKEVNYWTPEHLKAVNHSLTGRPYRGFVLVCPQTPNPSKFSDRKAMFDDYAAWLLEVLLPEVERRVPHSTRTIQLDGCSMGGYVGLELFVRNPTRFAAFGTVQSAIGAWRAPKYAQQLAALPPKARVPLRLSSSTRDPFLEANQQLSKELAKHKVAHELDVLPGPHDQPWLRELGTLEMLRWHDSVT